MLLKKMVMVEAVPVVFRYNPETKKGVLACAGNEERKGEKVLNIIKAKVLDMKFYGKRVRFVFTTTYADFKKGMEEILDEGLSVSDLPALGRMLWDEPR